jgi:hypothetical protein
MHWVPPVTSLKVPGEQEEHKLLPAADTEPTAHEVHQVEPALSA